MRPSRMLSSDGGMSIRPMVSSLRQRTAPPSETMRAIECAAGVLQFLALRRCSLVRYKSRQVLVRGLYGTRMYRYADLPLTLL